MDNAYGYDVVSNVLSVVNKAAIPEKGKAGGQMSYNYTYDALYRLSTASGTYKGADNKAASYTLSMGYDNMHRITSKKQHLSQTGVQFEGTLNAGYELAYTYGKDAGRKFQLDNVRDINYRTEETPTESMNINNGHKYTYDLNGNLVYINASRVKRDGKEDEKATEQKYRWDEENRLMVLSDNSKTSRYTYNAAGERIMKSYGTMEGVYINGAPQGITLTNVDFRLHQDKMSKLFCAWFALKFHETDNFTLYPASILSVNKNRFTKHYFLGDKRIASKIGTGLFNNVYGRNGSYVTAGQQDYTERMNQIQKQKEAYYKQQGIAPGVPTMKGAYGDPENTKRGYNSIIDTLGNHDVPQGWIQTPRPNTTPNTNPGPPVSWNDPSNPDDPQAGYGYIPNDTTKEETFFYHSDHLGSTSYITDDKANITQYDAYLPYGELLVDEHSSSEELPYKFNGKEMDEETGLYYYGARYMNPMASIWYGVDRFTEKYPIYSAYNICRSNPLLFFDESGDSTILFATTLPGADKRFLKGGGSLATHTFLVVKDKKGKMIHFAYGSEIDGPMGAFKGRLREVEYYDDLNVMNGNLKNHLKYRKAIEPPLKADGKKMSVEEFDRKVINVARSFGNNPNIKYFMLPGNNPTQGNCNTSSSTILHKAGVSNQQIKALRAEIPGIVSGFGSYRPWTASEQKAAIDERNTIIYNFWSNWNGIVK